MQPCPEISNGFNVDGSHLTRGKCRTNQFENQWILLHGFPEQTGIFSVHVPKKPHCVWQLIWMIGSRQSVWQCRREEAGPGRTERKSTNHGFLPGVRLLSPPLPSDHSCSANSSLLHVRLHEDLLPNLHQLLFHRHDSHGLRWPEPYFGPPCTLQIPRLFHQLRLPLLLLLVEHHELRHLAHFLQHARLRQHDPGGQIKKLK